MADFRFCILHMWDNALTHVWGHVEHFSSECGPKENTFAAADPGWGTRSLASSAIMIQ